MVNRSSFLLVLRDQHCRTTIPNNSVTLALARPEAIEDRVNYYQPMTITGKLSKHRSVFNFIEIRLMVEMEPCMTPSVKAKAYH